MLIESKENDINQFTDFINQYNFNIARSLIFKQIKKEKVKIFSNITFDQNDSKDFNYNINGSIIDAEVKLLNQLIIENIKFDFKIDKKNINLKEIKLSLDNISVSSDEINIKKINNDFKIAGSFSTNKSKINLDNLSKILNKNFDLIKNKFVNLSTNNKISFKINSKLKIKDLTINSKINFDELYTKSKYQDLIYLKNGKILINYIEDKLDLNLNSKFLFKNEKYNNQKSNNLIKLIYKKVKNKDALVKIDISNTKNKINSKEFGKFISMKNFSIQDQDIIFSSENSINFNLNRSNKIKNFNIKSKIKTDEVVIDYKSQRIKKYLSNFKNQINLSESNLDLIYNDKKFKFDLKSKYNINNINDDISLNIEKKC